MQDILKAHAGGEKQQVKLVKIYPESTLCLKTKVTEAMSYAPHGSRVEWTGVACREGLVGRLC